MSRLLALLAAARVAYAFSPPLFGWWREQKRRRDAQNRPCNDLPPRAYARP